MYLKFGFIKWTRISSITYPYITIPYYIMGLSSKRYYKLHHQTPIG